ncbi:MAG: glycosyltransferase [Bacteroidetes bacterium]|nr:glycosyltransferase [Bacteroidota bacterium]
MSGVIIAISGSKTGGAETRGIKIASALSKDIEVVLVINKDLHSAVLNNKLLFKCIENLKIVTISNSVLNKILYKTVLKIENYIPVFIARYIYVELIAFRWVKILSDYGYPVHNICGEISRIATAVVSAHKNVTIELTSNRLDSQLDRLERLIGYNEGNTNLIAVSDTVKDRYSKYGVTDVYQSAFVFKNNLREVKEENKENVIIFGHQLKKEKNAILFADAISDLYSENKLKSWRILILGDGPLRKQLESILSIPIKSRVVEIRESNNFVEELNKAKIFVSLIITGNYPSQSVAEAIESKCLLILSDTGLSREKYGESGICYTTLEKSDIKKKILHLIDLSETDLYKINTTKTYSLFLKLLSESPTQSLLNKYKTSNIQL